MQLMASLKVTETLETKVMDSAATTPCATPVTDAARPLIQQQPQAQHQQQEQQLQQAAQEQVSQDEVKEAKLLAEEGDTGKQGVIEDDHKDDEPIVQSVSETVDVVEVLVITDNDGEQSLTESTRGEDAASETSGVSENVAYKDNCSPDEGYGPDIASAMSEEVVEDDQAEGSEQTEISKSDEAAEASAEKDASQTQMKTSESGIEIPAIEISPVEEEAKLPFQLDHSRSESTVSDIEATTAIAVLEQAVQQAYESMTKQAESNDPLDEPEEEATGDDQVVPDVSSSLPKEKSDSEVKDVEHGEQKEQETKDEDVEIEAVEEDGQGVTGDGEDEGGLGSGQASTESLSTDL